MVGLGLSFWSIPSGAVELCMGGVVTLAWDNVSCQESADHSQNKMYLCQGEKKWADRRNQAFTYKGKDMFAHTPSHRQTNTYVQADKHGVSPHSD